MTTIEARWRAGIAAFVCAVLLAPAASAGPADIDTLLLRPSFGPNGLLSVTGADPGRQWTVRTGSVLQYEHAPLVVLTGDTETARLVAHRVGLTLGGFIAVHDRVGMGISVPIVWQSGDVQDWPRQLVSAGDLRTELVWRLTNNPIFKGALTLRTHYPTSTPDSFTGERWPRVAPGFVIEAGGSRGGFVLSAELGIRAPVHTGFDLGVSTEIASVLGGRVVPVPERLDVFAELALRVSLGPRAEGSWGKAPLDLRAGVRLKPTRKLAIDVGLGAGLNSGFGNAVIRALVGVTFLYEPPKRKASAPPPRDRRPPDEVVLPPPRRERPPPELDPLFDDLVDVAPEEDPCAPAVDRFDVDDAFEDPEPRPEADEDRAEEGEQPAELLEELDRIEINQPIRFAHDSAVLLPEAHEVLDAVRDILVERPDIALLVVEGHASSEGSSGYNWELSNARSAAVFRYLVEAGISPYRLAWRGMGEAVPRPAGASVDDTSLAENRRVEFRIERWSDGPDASSPGEHPVPWGRDAEEDAE